MKKDLLLGAALLLFSLAVCELGLQIVCFISPAFNDALNPDTDHPLKTIPLKIDDAILGFRGNPEVRGHDGRGFRNAAALNKTDIVTLGDSWTYGIDVLPGNAWPAVLGKTVHKSVYNMGFPGYGPAHYSILLNEALKLKPGMVLVGIYFGNDFFDTFEKVYFDEAFKNFRNASLETEAGKLDLQNPLISRISTLRKEREESSQQSTEDMVLERKKSSRAKRVLVTHVKLLQLILRIKENWNHLKRRSNEEATPDWNILLKKAQHHPLIFNAVDSKGFKTLFTPDYRLIALDMKDVRIKAGLDSSVLLLSWMNSMAKQQDSKLMVILFPTKELVFSTTLSVEEARQIPRYQELITAETQAREEFKMRLSAEKISYYDTLPVLQNALEAGQMPFLSSDDGHPNRLGNEIIARALAEKIS